jgi:hypothetical protein
LQDPGEINGDNLNNVRRGASRHCKNKRRDYLKDRINEHAVNSKNKNIRDLYGGINEFKKGYQSRTNLVRMRMMIYFQMRRRNYFSQVLNVCRVIDVRHIERHTDEPLVPDPMPFEVEIAITKL